MNEWPRRVKRPETRGEEKDAEEGTVHTPAGDRKKPASGRL